MCIFRCDSDTAVLKYSQDGETQYQLLPTIKNETINFNNTTESVDSIVCNNSIKEKCKNLTSTSQCNKTSGEIRKSVSASASDDVKVESYKPLGSVGDISVIESPTVDQEELQSSKSQFLMWVKY